VAKPLITENSPWCEKRESGNGGSATNACS